MRTREVFSCPMASLVDGSCIASKSTPFCGWMSERESNQWWGCMILNIVDNTWGHRSLSPASLIVIVFSCCLVVSMCRLKSSIPLGLCSVDGGSSQIPVPI